MNEIVFNLLTAIASLLLAPGLISPALNDATNLIPVVLKMESVVTDYKAAQEKAPLEAIGRVFMNENPFSVNSEELIYLYDYYVCSNIGELSAKLSMAILDMDGDGVYEVVLKEDKIGISLVFHYKEGQVYAYAFDKREMSFLKNDGTFVWSKDMYDNGYAKLNFNGNKVDVVELAAFKPPKTGHPSIKRTINGTVVTAEVFNEFVLEQEEKVINWYTFAEENITQLNKLVNGSIYDNKTIMTNPKLDEVINSIKCVLQQETPLFDNTAGFIFLNDCFKYNIKADGVQDNVSMQIIDLNNDLIPEVVLPSNRQVLYVLYYYKGQVFMHSYGYRSMNDLKKDGTFLWSSGAPNWGIGRLKFDRYNADIINIAYVNEDYCEVNGESVTYQEFIDFINKQEEKEDPAWYDFTDENISNVKNLFTIYH